MKITTKEMSWESPAFNPASRKASWYWALGIIAVAIIALAIVFSNWLLAIIVALGTLILVILSRREPEMVTTTIMAQGIILGKELIPFDIIEAFWVREIDGEYNELMINKVNGVHQLEIVLLGKDVDPDFLRSTLSDFVPEIEMKESFSHRIVRWIGL